MASSVFDATEMWGYEHTIMGQRLWWTLGLGKQAAMRSEVCQDAPARKTATGVTEAKPGRTPTCVRMMCVLAPWASEWSRGWTVSQGDGPSRDTRSYWLYSGHRFLGKGVCKPCV